MHLSPLIDKICTVPSSTKPEYETMPYLFMIVGLFSADAIGWLQECQYKNCGKERMKV